MRGGDPPAGCEPVRQGLAGGAAGPRVQVRVDPAGLGEADLPRRLRDFRLSEIGKGYALRVPFSAMKGVSEAEVERMVAGRPYTSLADFWERARPSRPGPERIVAGRRLGRAAPPAPGRGDRWRPGELTRRDLIAQVGVLERASASGVQSGPRTSRRYTPKPVQDRQAAVQLPMGFAERIAPGELPEMTETEMVEAELEILGMDVSRHVVSFHDELLDVLGVTRAKDLLDLRNGAEVAGGGGQGGHPDARRPFRPADHLRHARRLDRADGPDLLRVGAGHDARPRCSARGCWSPGGWSGAPGARAVSMRALDCWNLVDLDAVWRSAAPTRPAPS